jgi:hypothetical protein
MDSNGCRRSSAAVSADAPGSAGTALFGDLGSQCLGLTDQGAQAGAPFEHLIDLVHDCPGSGKVGQGEVDTG